MKDNLKFPYNNYIGEHMSEPLEIKLKQRKIYDTYSFSLGGIHNDFLFDNSNNYPDDYHISDCKPLIKSSADLTTKEKQYILLGEDDIDLGHIFENSDGYFGISDSYNNNSFVCGSHECGRHYLSQEQLNRGYSLHWNPNAEELINNGLAERKEG